MPEKAALHQDRIHGQGVAVFASGNRYEGTWENGRIHGHGTELTTFSNFAVCESVPVTPEEP